jgi:DNA-binding response OmpR family regulator
MSARQGATILLIEDDPEIALMLRDVLESRGYRVEHAEGGAKGEVLLERVHPDLVLLDLMLPDADGLVLCANLKARADVPIIICSATTSKRDSILGFKLGADDFIAKPFEPAELEARVEALLRRTAQTRTMAAPPGSRSADALPRPPRAAIAGGDQGPAAASADGGVGGQPSAPDHIRLGPLEIDNSRRSVTLGDRPIAVTPTEYRLLRALASRPEQVLSREELAERVWGYQDVGISRAMDVHMRRLRAKLGEGPVPAPPIVAVRGFGFKITTEMHAKDE